MDDVLADRAKFVFDKLTEQVHRSPPKSPTDLPHSLPESACLLIAIAGVPAPGKSTFAARLVEIVNASLESHPSGAQAVPVGLDGWHLTCAQLDAMPDPKHAHDRRGAHWTFDAPAYAAFVTRLRDRDAAAVYVPLFDHAIKYRMPDAILVALSHRVVVFEGFYTMLDVELWKGAAVLMDERWLLHPRFP